MVDLRFTSVHHLKHKEHRGSHLTIPTLIRKTANTQGAGGGQNML